MSLLDLTLQGRSWLSAAVSLVIITIATLLLTLVPIRSDNDCWWHVKSGEYISANGLPEKDVFAHTAEDYDWHNHEWLTQVAMWKIHDFGERTSLGGWRMLLLATGIVVWLTMLLFWFLAWQISGNHWIALWVVLMALGVGRRTYFARPPVVTNLLLALLILVLYGVQERGISRWFLLALPPLFALWSNLHGGWFAGLVVLSAAGLQNIIHHIQYTRNASLQGPQALFDSPPHPIPWSWLLTIGPGCFFATLMNPFTYHLYALPARVMSKTELVQNLGELMPPQIPYVTDFVLIIILMIFAGAVSRKSSRRFAEIFLVVFFFWQAIHHVRHLLLFAVMIVPFMARLLADVVDQTTALVSSLFQRWGLSLKAVPAVVCLGLLIASAGWSALIISNRPETETYINRFQQYREIREGYIKQNFPFHLCNYIELVDFDGKMFNENNYAGYLIWRLAPERKVFSDPRFDIFGDDIWRDEQVITTGYVPPKGLNDPSWEDLLNQHGVTYVLARFNTMLDVRLEEDADWELVADFQNMQYPNGRPIASKPWRIYILKSAYPEDFPARAKRLYEGYSAPFVMR
ncbi:MAG: hypothetical protein ACFCU1_09655 [Sumerlaeia bacterium]